jgi:HCOMODA/2-hydroxy-3-carboxy-muconic semialdehyde decarboxylase
MRWINAMMFLVLLASSAQAQDVPSDPRELLVWANRILAMEGLVGPYGHVSFRVENEARFRIADHRSPDQVVLEHITEVDVDITPEEAQARGLYREVFIHASIYRELPDVKAVVHTHAPNAVALGTLSVSDNRILPTTNPGANLGNFIPVYGTVGLIGTPEKGLEVALALEGQNGVLLRGHGTVVVGGGLEQAVLRAIYLEFEASSQMRARAAGEPIPYRSDESDLFKRTVAIEHAWHFYIDKLKSLGQAP